MTPELVRLRRSPLRWLKDGLHAVQDLAAKAYGQPGSGFKTDIVRAGKPVIFIHNPKSGGTSLGKYLGVKRRSHTYPRDRLSEKAWVGTYSIVVVRDPFERFLSCYCGNVIRPGNTGLTKRYGPAVKSLDPFGFLRLILANPKFGGTQLNWTEYPSRAKPRADLILRFEDIGRWEEILKAEGIVVPHRTLHHENRSERAQSNHLERLGLTAERFAELRAEVMSAFTEDVRAFSYSAEQA